MNEIIQTNKNNYVIYMKNNNSWQKTIFDKPVVVTYQDIVDDNYEVYINDILFKQNDYTWIPVNGDYEIKSILYKEFIVYIEFLKEYKLIVHFNNGKRKFVDLQPLIDFNDYYKFIENYFYQLKPGRYDYDLIVPNVKINNDQLIIYNNYIKNLPYIEEEDK